MNIRLIIIISFILTYLLGWTLIFSFFDSALSIVDWVYWGMVYQSFCILMIWFLWETKIDSRKSTKFDQIEIIRPMFKPSFSTQKILNILKWLLLVFFVIDLMWGPNGITGKYIAMFLDNFSPFQNKYEARIASSPVYFQYDVFLHQQLKKICQQNQLTLILINRFHKNRKFFNLSLFS